MYRGRARETCPWLDTRRGPGVCAANLTWPRPCGQKNGGHARQVWGEGMSELVMWGLHAALNLRMCLGGPGRRLGSQGKLEQQGEVWLGPKEWWILGSIAGLSNPRTVTRGRNSPTGNHPRHPPAPRMLHEGCQPLGSLHGEGVSLAK